MFLCTYGGSKHGSNGCRRTYLSQRDLNAHIAHRHLKSEMKDQTIASAPAKAVSSATQLKTAMATGAASLQSHQVLVDQFNAALRQSPATAALAQRTAPETMYLGGQVAGMSLGMPVSSSYPAGLTQQAYTQGTVMQSMTALSATQPVMTQSHAVSSAPQESSYTSAIPVVGSRIKTLISVPIQDDDYSKKLAQPQSYQPTHAPATAMPNVNMNFPPPSFPVGSMAPNIHQPPPAVPPPMFSSQAIQPRPTQSFTSPPPQMMTTGPPRAPPRMTAPPGAPPPRFFDNQAPRGPWTGPPRGPSGPPHPPRGPPRADYNYY